MPNIVLNKQVKANLKILFGFLHERQEIWHKRFVLHKRPPWTKDKILQTNHFTNVYREIDPGTVYWFDTIYNNFHDDPKQLLYATMIYRMCNRQSTFEYLEDKQPFPFWNEKETIKYFCEYFAEAPDPKFTSAHIVAFGPGRSKLEGYLDSVRQLAPMIPRLYKAITKAKTLRRVHAILCNSVSGIGGFIAYEIIQCLVFAGILKQSINEWANVGPGCMRGMQIVFGEQTAKWSRTGYEKVLKQVWERQNEFATRYGDGKVELPVLKDLQQAFGNRTSVRIAGCVDKPLSLLCIESSFCEICKYFRCLSGGHTRCKFKPIIE